MIYFALINSINLILESMKKITLLLFAITLTFSVFAQQQTAKGTAKPTAPTVSLVSDNGKKIVVDFHLNGFNTSKVSTPRGEQDIISAPRMVSMLQAGAPDLPHYAIPAIIGDKAEMQVNIAKAKYTDYENVEIAPSKGNFSRQINPDDVPYTYGEAYSTNAFFPATQATLDAPYIIRDFRGQNIMVTPFAYNPVTKTLRVYTDLTIEMNKMSDNGVNPKTRNNVSRKMAPENKAEYGHRFINFNEKASKYTFIEDRGEMLIICPSQYMDAMQPFVKWKNLSGRPTTMVSLDDAGGNNDNNIKNYIQNIYNDPSRNLKYVLLVGDYSDLTPHSFSQGGESGRSDIWFGQLEGNDLYPELIVGRFSVGNIDDVNTHVNKVLYYERDMPAGLTWLNKGLGIAANEGSGGGHNGGEADYVHMNYIRDTLLHYTYQSVSQQYSGVGGGTSANAISTVVNDGVSMINYCNHGDVNMWVVASYSNNHVNSLSNDYKLPYIISVACLNGQFNQDCFAEAWLRATNDNTGAPAGAIGGMFSWISQPWTPPMTGQDEMINIITEWKHSDQFNHTMGGAFINGSTYILDTHNDNNGKATELSWLVFGDPSLMIRTDNPVDMNISYSPQALMLGMQSLTVNAETDFGIATLSMNGEIISSSYIVDGQAELTFETLNEVGTAKLVVIGYNKVTYETDIEILPAEGAYITLDSFTPDATHVGDLTSMTLRLKNIGVDATTGTTTIELSSDDPRISFENHTGSIEALASDATNEIGGFTFTISPDANDEDQIPITVTSTCGEKTWTSNIKITANKAVLEYEGFSWKGSYTPGETFTATASFKNVGHYKSQNAVVNISSDNEYVTLPDNNIEYGTIMPDGTILCYFTVSISDECPVTTVLPLHFTITDSEGNTAEGDATLANSCNVVFDLHDSYGDGWNGCSLTVTFSDETPQQTMTISSGSSNQYVLSINSGTIVTVKFNQGSGYNGGYSYETSYEVYYEDDSDNPIHTATSSGYTGPSTEPWNFTVDCGGEDGSIELLPVVNLTATVEGLNDIVLTWDAPTRANITGYTIYRDDLDEPVGTTEETTFTDEGIHIGTYYYTVEANYVEGNVLSNPVKVIIEEDGINENAVNVNIYPNPAKETIHIVGNKLTEVRIYNLYGQEVHNTIAQSDNVEINISNLASGVYVVKTKSKNGSNVQRIAVR